MNKKVSLRQCVGCGEMKEKKNMVRIVRTSEDAFVLDRTGKLNGRGAYICEDADCLSKAMKNHGLEKSFHQAISAEVYDALKAEFKNIEK